MELKEAILGRRSIRGFLNKPVPKEVIEEVLKLGTRAVSGMNIQPWSFAVVTGEPLNQLRELNLKNDRAGLPIEREQTETGKGNVYWDRRLEVAKKLFGLMGIERHDIAARNAWMDYGWRFFDAPAAIFVFANKAIREAEGYFDAGCVTQNICVAAMEYGLGTCVQEQTVSYHQDIWRVLGISEQQRPIVGIALGYPDPDFPANKLYTTRAELDEVTTWAGF